MAFSYTNAYGVVLKSSGANVKAFLGTAKADTLQGTSGNDIMRGYGGGDTYIGGLGDDTYVISSIKDKVVELGGEGNDTVRSSVHYTLAANVENLILEGNGSWYGGGNALDNVIIGNDAVQQLDGGAGNDVLVGGGGADTFIVTAGNGSDVITDFVAGTDQVRLGGYGVTSFSEVQSAAKQVGNDTVISFDNGESLTLRGVQATSLVEKDFIYEIDKSGFVLNFSDNFDSLSLYSDGGTWRTEYGHGGPGTVDSHTLPGESEVYMDPDWAGTGTEALGVNPFSIDDGILTITAAPASEEVQEATDGHTYTSGLLTTKFTYAQQYGYFEIRCAMPEGQGFWPAFWLLPTDNSWPPELDVFEMLGGDPNTVYMTAHDQEENGTHTYDQERTVIDTSEYHTYAVDWNEERIIYYIDGAEVARIDTPDSMKKEMYMLVNLAVGGDSSWGGGADETTGTGELKIDYIRAYRTEDTVSATINGTHTVYDGSGTSEGTVTDGTTPATEEVSNAGTATGKTYTGTSGDDTFRVTSTLDKVVEAANCGKDTVNSTVSYTLAANVETLILSGAAAIDATGNELDNRLIGNELANTLTGLAGADYMDGGAGADTMTGGLGDDTYIVDNVGDKAVEKAGEGSDLVISSVSYTLADNIENLRLSGTEAIDGTGNALANRMIGTTGANVLTGGAGNDYLDGAGGTDKLVGGLGDDTFVIGNTGVQVIEKAGEGTDTVSASISHTLSDNVEILRFTGSAAVNGSGNALNNTLQGNEGANRLFGLAGNDTLSGGLGKDVLNGGVGDDTLTGGADADMFVFGKGYGKDTVTDFQSGVDKLVLVGVAAGGYSISQSGSTTTLTVGTDKITIQGGFNAADISLMTQSVYDTSIGLMA